MQQSDRIDVREACAAARSALRAGRAATAERQLREIQRLVPGEVESLALLGGAMLAQNKLHEAIDALERVTAAAPRLQTAHIDLGRAYRAAGRLDAARAQVRRVLEAAPSAAAGWLAYGDVLVDLGQYGDAVVAYERARQCDPKRARIEAATQAFLAKDRRGAETLFRSVLREDAAHVFALCGLAALSLAAGRHADAERLLRHALLQSAHLPLAKRGLAHTLLEAGRLAEAEGATLDLLRVESENAQNWVVLGTVYARLLRQEQALAAYEEAARRNPQLATLRLSIGHLQKTLGRRAACERAYHECLTLDPGFADAYWALADLKNYEFSAAEIEAMQALAQRVSSATLNFALGRACEQLAEYPAAFAWYAKGNALRRVESPFDIEAFEAKSRRVRECFDAGFFAARRGWGWTGVRGAAPGATPIFIVGLPRSGSTLVEQILASHSSVEGTMELPNVLTLVRELDAAGPAGDGYPESVRGLPAERSAALGERYLRETLPIRQGRPYFIDKMPNNFSHVGLIHCMLPGALVIDVRRHPMDACFSGFKQHFAEGQSFTYDLADLGRYYRCYLALMDHWDAVLPGRVLHVQYETLVREPEAGIRALLAHCNLAFEPATLKFHETSRPVRTASAEQVRRPLSAGGIGYWRRFEGELEPLRRSLGDCLERFAALGC